jgi:hypothetical protein
MRQVVEQLLAAVEGALTGNARWHNRLKGFGTGLATIATEHNLGGGTARPVLAEKRRRDEQAAASTTATGM